jgi:putative transposase
MKCDGVRLRIKRHGRVGHVFQGRFKVVLVQRDTHFLEVSRYVVLNPVGAKTISHPRQWKWSSYGATAGIVSLMVVLVSMKS